MSSNERMMFESESVKVYQEKTKLSEEPDVVKNSIAGSFSGISRVLVGQPFDTVKVRMQAQSRSSQQLYSNSMDCVMKMIKNEGILSFYKGTLSPLLVVGLCASIQFSVAEHVKGEYRKTMNGKPLNYSQIYVAGVSAGFAQSFINGPVEHIRTRMQLQTNKVGSTQGKEFLNPLDAAKKIFAKAGFRGIFKAQGITCLRECQAYAGLFVTYEWAKRQVTTFTGVDRKDFHAGHIAVAGAISGYGMWVPIFPLDSIKSRLQSDSLVKSEAKYKGALDCAIKTFKTEGIRGFFKGFTPCMLRAAPVNAAIFLTFENVIDIIGRN